MRETKSMCGLKFKFEPYDKEWDRTYDERWICDIGHFVIDVAVHDGQHQLHGIHAIVHSERGWSRHDGDTLELAVESAISYMNEEAAKYKQHWDEKNKVVRSDSPFFNYSFPASISFWENELADARAGKMSKIRKAKIRGNILTAICAALFIAMCVGAIFAPKTYTCSCPCQCK